MPRKASTQTGATTRDVYKRQEHVVGVAKGAPEEIIQGLRENFAGECSEVGMYLAMARVAHREGYPEIGLYWELSLIHIFRKPAISIGPLAAPREGHLVSPR